MKILFLASSGDFHVDVWTKYFTKNNLVYLFCERGTHLKEQDYKNVVKIKSNGVLGWFLNKLQLHFLFNTFLQYLQSLGDLNFNIFIFNFS